MSEREQNQSPFIDYHLICPMPRRHDATTPRVILLLVMLSCAFFSASNNAGKDVITWDAFGYYLYLPATFIHHDLDLSEDWADGVYVTYEPSPSKYQLVEQKDGKRTIKYSSGLAILYSPGFFVGHVIASVTTYPTDGFSKPYQKAMLWWVILFNLLGIWLFYRFLEEEFNPLIALITCVLVVFGTNYLLTAYISILMPHGLLFTLYAALLRACQHFRDNPGIRSLLVLVSILALMVLSRPTEIIAVLIPLFFTGKLIGNGSMLDRVRKRWWPAFLPLIILGFLQMLYWKHTAGSWLYLSYDNPAEGLDLASPHLLDGLFSFRKGWLFWTPISMVAISGWMFVRSHMKWGALIFIVMNVWIILSWSTWWYAESFGHRAFVQSYPVVFIGLALVLKYTLENRSQVRIPILFLAVFFGALSLFKSWQFTHWILPGDRITSDYYWATFFDLEPRIETKELLLVDRFTREPDPEVLEKNYQSTSIETVEFHTDAYPFVYKQAYSELTSRDHFMVKITGYDISRSMEDQFHFDLCVVSKGRICSFSSHQILGRDTIVLLSPEVRYPSSDTILLQMVNTSEEPMIDQALKLEFFERIRN
ncbi:hypothetical protein [Sanyastnella coralliicola]|uniref:hypothetical protein n=1 Tax=Sanyastnella coralliicola TaxID=3069118 RepID=UPI0027B9FD04|nr:hypothetical protein [Longitalea sp. SCSIO 12813]